MKNLFKKGQMVEIVATGEERKVVAFGYDREDKVVKYQLEGVDIFFPETALSKALTRRELKSLLASSQGELIEAGENVLALVKKNGVLLATNKLLDAGLGEATELLQKRDKKIKALEHLVAGYKGLGEL